MIKRIDWKVLPANPIHCLMANCHHVELSVHLWGLRLVEGVVHRADFVLSQNLLHPLVLLPGWLWWAVFIGWRRPIRLFAVLVRKQGRLWNFLLFYVEVVLLLFPTANALLIGQLSRVNSLTHLIRELSAVHSWVLHAILCPIRIIPSLLPSSLWACTSPYFVVWGEVACGGYIRLMRVAAFKSAQEALEPSLLLKRLDVVAFAQWGLIVSFVSQHVNFLVDDVRFEEADEREVDFELLSWVGILQRGTLIWRKLESLYATHVGKFLHGKFIGCVYNMRFLFDKHLFFVLDFHFVFIQRCLQTFFDLHRLLSVQIF